MKRRDFLERVSELAKGTAGAVTLSKVQIGAAAAALAAVGCEKWSPVNTTNEKESVIYDCIKTQTCYFSYPCQPVYGCTPNFECNPGNKFLCQSVSCDDFTCWTPFPCEKNACKYPLYKCQPASSFITGGSGCAGGGDVTVSNNPSSKSYLGWNV